MSKGVKQSQTIKYVKIIGYELNDITEIIEESKNVKRQILYHFFKLF
jgi:hypothetical protein